MTTTKELVHTFKAQGGRTKIIPQGIISNDLVLKSVFAMSHAYSRKRLEIRNAYRDANARGKQLKTCREFAAVDVFMRFRNDKGI